MSKSTYVIEKLNKVSVSKLYERCIKATSKENESALTLVECYITLENKGIKQVEFLSKVDISKSALSQMLKAYKFIYDNKRMDLIEKYGFKYRNIYTLITNGITSDIESMFTLSASQIADLIKKDSEGSHIEYEEIVHNGKLYRIPVSVLKKYEQKNDQSKFRESAHLKKWALIPDFFYDFFQAKKVYQ